DCIFSMVNFILFFFFFQAEDGIRDKLVTGVQTCALPIYDQAGPHFFLLALLNCPGGLKGSYVCQGREVPLIKTWPSRSRTGNGLVWLARVPETVFRRGFCRF